MNAAGARVLLSIILLSSALCRPAVAHEVRPAYLQLTELANGQVDVLWKQPSTGQLAVRLVPHVSGGLIDGAPTSIQSAPNFQISLWQRLDAGAAGLQGRTIAIEGIEQTITDVLVTIRLNDGDDVQEILKPGRPSFTVHTTRAGMPVPAYLWLGIEHILTGIDHLMFILGLILLVRGAATLVTTVTAFTVAHSITLAATALEVLYIKSAIVEALVAMSIVFLAVELVRSYKGATGLTIRYPWLIALTFGLLHGTAFAGALAEIGLPPDNIPLSLLLFNIGVELGQLLFVAIVLVAIGLLRRLPRPLPAWSHAAPAYAIGTSAAFWFIERLQLALT